MKNMSLKNISGLAGWAAVAATAVNFSAAANVITMDLGSVLAGSFVNGDGSSAPYVVATFTDVAGGVQLEITCPGLGFAGSGDYEHINQGTGLLLDVANSYVGALTFTETAWTVDTSNPKVLGSTITPATITQGANAYTGAASGQKFDINMSFAENDQTELGYGKTITYLITSTVGGLAAADFAQLDASGNYYAEASIDDANKGLYIGATGYSNNTVPDPVSTVTFLGLALCGVGVLSRKFGRA